MADPLALDTATVNIGEGRHAYCYDHAGRLLRWDRPLPTDGVAPDDEDDCGERATLTDDVDVTAYSWDAAGNRLSAGNPATPAEVGRYGYDERNRLTAGPGGEYRWTPRATMLESSDGASAATYGFDGLGRQVARGGVTYAFDGLDRIAVRTAADADSPTPATADFAYAGVELDPVDDNVADATTGAVDVGGRYARSPSGRLLAVEQDGDDARLAALNRHGDLSVLHDADGTLTDTRVWDPFGGQAGVSGTTLPAVGFQADWTDPASGQVWMGARFYDPANATFSARDTYGGELVTPVTLNRYTYATNNPLRYFDPDGRRVIASTSMNSETREQRAVSHAYASGDDTVAAANRVRRQEGRPTVEQQAWERTLLTAGGGELSMLALESKAAMNAGDVVVASAMNELIDALAVQAWRSKQAVEISWGPMANGGFNRVGVNSTDRVAIYNWSRGVFDHTVVGTAEALVSIIPPLRDVASGVQQVTGRSVSDLRVFPTDQTRAASSAYTWGTRTAVAADIALIAKGLTKLAATGAARLAPRSLSRSMDTVEAVAGRGGVGLDGVKVQILDDVADADTVRYLDAQGAVARTDDLGIQLHPKAFADEETLLRTLAHERTHAYQIKTFPEYGSGHVGAFEDAAYGIEDSFWRYYQGGR